MLFKLVLLGVIITVCYVLAVFNMPNVSKSVDSMIGIDGLTDTIRGGKNTFDGAITDIPSVSEFKSGAVDIGIKITDGVTTTKDTIDTVREGVQKVEEGYNQAKDTYETIQDTFSGATEQIEKIQGAVNTISEITNTQTEDVPVSE